MLVSITLYSINHMGIDTKGMGVLPRMGVLPHLTLHSMISEKMKKSKLKTMNVTFKSSHVQSMNSVKSEQKIN